MSELTKMTVQALRDLARKALGRGHSRFKTKSELIAALQSAEKKVSGAAEKAAARMKEATGRAAKAAEKMVETAKGKGAAARGARSAKGTAKAAKERPAREEREERARKSPVAAKGARKPAAAAAAPPSAPPAAAPVAAGEPDPEGHLVARIAGEGAVRDAPHAMTESAAGRPTAQGATAKGLRPEHAFDEQLGELPWSYGDDAFTALPRDPRTLFLYWDHAEQTLRHVWAGLDGGRPQLWVFAQRADGGWDRVRTVDFALESRSYYVHDLEPGRVYRAEIHLVDRHGLEKLLGGASNAIALPPVGPSPVVDDRFLRIEWGASLQRLLAHARAGGAFPEELRAQFARLSDWGRFGAAGGGGSAGGIGGRPTSGPSSPTSPFGGPPSRGEGR